MCVAPIMCGMLPLPRPAILLVDKTNKKGFSGGPPPEVVPHLSPLRQYFEASLPVRAILLQTPDSTAFEFWSRPDFSTDEESDVCNVDARPHDCDYVVSFAY